MSYLELLSKIHKTIFVCLFYMGKMSFILTICPIRSFLSHMNCPTNLELTWLILLSNGTELLDNCLVPYSLSNHMHICPTNVLFGNIVLNSCDNLYVSLLYGQMSFILTICPIRSFLSNMICPTNLDFVRDRRSRRSQTSGALLFIPDSFNTPATQTIGQLSHFFCLQQ